MEMGILRNAEADGASLEIRSCWELLCAELHRAAPHHAAPASTASEGRRQARSSQSRLRMRPKGPHTGPHTPPQSQLLVARERATGADVPRAPRILG